MNLADPSIHLSGCAFSSRPRQPVGRIGSDVLFVWFIFVHTVGKGFAFDSSLSISYTMENAHCIFFEWISFRLNEHPDHSEVTTLAVPLKPLVFPLVIGYNNKDDNNSDNNHDIGKDNDWLILGGSVLPKSGNASEFALLNGQFLPKVWLYTVHFLKATHARVCLIGTLNCASYDPSKGLVPFTQLVKVRRVTWFWHF